MLVLSREKVEKFTNRATKYGQKLWYHTDMNQAVLEQKVKELEQEVSKLRRLVVQKLAKIGESQDEYRDDFVEETLRASREIAKGNFVDEQTIRRAIRQ